MVPYVSTPVTRVLLAFLARHVAKNKVPEKEAVPEQQEKFKARKLNSQFAIFTKTIMHPIYPPKFCITVVSYSQVPLSGKISFLILGQVINPSSF